MWRGYTLPGNQMDETQYNLFNRVQVIEKSTTKLIEEKKTYEINNTCGLVIQKQVIEISFKLDKGFKIIRIEVHKLREIVDL